MGARDDTDASQSIAMHRLIHNYGSVWHHFW